MPVKKPEEIADAILNSMMAGISELTREVLKKRISDAIYAERVPHPIGSAPRDGSFIILLGDSGYTTTPLRAAIGRWYPEYRPFNPWQTHSNDAFTDNGSKAKFWMSHPILKP